MSLGKADRRKVGHRLRARKALRRRERKRASGFQKRSRRVGTKPEDES